MNDKEIIELYKEMVDAQATNVRALLALVARLQKQVEELTSNAAETEVPDSEICAGVHCKCMNKNCPRRHYGDHECPHPGVNARYVMGLDGSGQYLRENA